MRLGFVFQECLEKFLRGTGGLQNRELLMVHYLQQANYIPALQLNHSLKMNLVVCWTHVNLHMYIKTVQYSVQLSLCVPRMKETQNLRNDPAPETPY